jgi:hypothetical protein
VEIVGKRSLAQHGYSADRQESEAKIHNHTHNNRSFSQYLGNYKACCCDERCESVETVKTGIVCTTYIGELEVVFCENLGKQGVQPTNQR